MKRCAQVTFLLTSFAFLPLFSQPKTFFSISKYERCWAIFHPFAAYKIKRRQGEMHAIYQDVKKSGVLDQYENGGKLDAFRHTFAMAYFARFVAVRKLRKLGKAHEKGDRRKFFKGQAEEAGELADSLSLVMDLRNNELGFALGREFRKIPIGELKQKVIQKVNEGAAFIMKRDAQGRYLDCRGTVIPPEKIKGTWNIPKCLVGSHS